ncbi:zf-DHHC-domain-containing protein [Neurospora crassa]|uniref:Palmitoyltransferase SWF1 n=1 Tax=Neurospora crassa (strain ATCC 24698 / 74-OR23-1A / CBS 708.71 / DSM 1257 / FGSC 987) TaxID=367110 RepID=SWF1_NEUCR|nr:palmitoyltransferase SWF1 [Neurospora crassa OR74A]Q7RWM9.1 RecName: Full=Palmitoyltransferase SWF1 [Neurospora crassa OR74A]EAA26840.1 palmitoyltransferase SWF1 [Neurospora crassa OR74A]KHE81416.1 zf-DHHC-domain-containing protein [Neurospora crassa]|eukprot:XP_956076.1 palmitoyltransferase SWF1 [Neurospora crassa OR74A]
MGTIAIIAAVILGISFMTFVAFFGRLPALRNTPISFLHRLIWIHLPNGILTVDRTLTNGRLTTSLTRLGRHLWYDQHPTILIFFFLLLSVGEYLYLPVAWPHFSFTHKFFGTIAILCPYIFLYLSAYTDPGVINAKTHVREMARYPYDFTLFHPGTSCETCHLLKPARSKHCSICKKCVGRMDHHCIFINNCVGANNQRWFILLLLSTAILTLYGGVLGLVIIRAKIQARFPYWTLMPWWTSTQAWNSGDLDFHRWLLLWSWGLQSGVAMGGVTLLALLTTPLVWGLLGYHLWLVYCGTTTNESMKWQDWQAEMDEGGVYKRRMAADGSREKDLKVEPAWTRWPVEAEQIMVRTEDGKPPRSSHRLPGEGEWEAVWRLKDVENLYDIGFWDNLVDVFLPYFMFKESKGRSPVDEREFGRERGRNRRRSS